ncbi:hypothetical protein HAX54_020157 [Datura stramonium]|uniref:MSP domain-containing protein n=1 Tax=Datura stramonium TaxID=4076 RepID=A0ABS8UQP5_DATST|nr:hypothetical protein [Datura stramonium]
MVSRIEVKKQSSCAVHIANITDQHVAFKVKTTSPKKYCVRPNIGVIKPKSTYDFTVTMQAQRTAPSDMQCKDKFLIQCAVVPFGTSEEEISPSMFNKDNGKYVEECKLKVVLVNHPTLQFCSQLMNFKQGASIETLMQQEKFPRRSQDWVNCGCQRFELCKNIDEVVENNKDADFDAEEEEPIISKRLRKMLKLNSPKNMESNTNEVVKSRHLNTETKSSLTKDFEELKSKINSLDSQLIEALLRTKGVGKESSSWVSLFLCMVALICLTIGYLVPAANQALNLQEHRDEFCIE